MKEIKILVVEPSKKPLEVRVIKNELHELQAIVGGYIEVVMLEDVALVCNEEGKLLNLKPNIRIGNDIICGTFFLCGVDGEDFASLTDEQIEKYITLFD